MWSQTALPMFDVGLIIKIIGTRFNFQLRVPEHAPFSQQQRAQVRGLKLGQRASRRQLARQFSRGKGTGHSNTPITWQEKNQNWWIFWKTNLQLQDINFANTVDLKGRHYSSKFWGKGDTVKTAPLIKWVAKQQKSSAAKIGEGKPKQYIQTIINKRKYRFMELFSPERKTQCYTSLFFLVRRWVCQWCQWCAGAIGVTSKHEIKKCAVCEEKLFGKKMNLMQEKYWISFKLCRS